MPERLYDDWLRYIAAHEALAGSKQLNVGPLSGRHIQDWKLQAEVSADLCVPLSENASSEIIDRNRAAVERRNHDVIGRHQQVQKFAEGVWIGRGIWGDWVQWGSKAGVLRFELGRRSFCNSAHAVSEGRALLTSRYYGRFPLSYFH